MAEPFLAEIRIFSFNFAPQGWAMCNGQFLPINQNQALFSLLGTMYGGNGQTTFALPNLQGRTPIHTGGQIGATLGEVGGQENHTLTISEMPTHVHVMNGASDSADQPVPNDNLLGGNVNGLYQPPDRNLTTLDPSSVTNVGGSQPHLNQQPFLVLNVCIALQGIFPSRN
jgi:microcystin-dependent protein